MAVIISENSTLALLQRYGHGVDIKMGRMLDRDSWVIEGTYKSRRFRKIIAGQRLIKDEWIYEELSRVIEQCMWASQPLWTNSHLS